jgi:hypothetical protein
VQLWQALAVLGMMSVLGVLLPLFVMSLGPSEFSPLIKSLIWPFLFGYLLLVAYFTRFAVRLSRQRR